MRIEGFAARSGYEDALQTQTKNGLQFLPRQGAVAQVPSNWWLGLVGI